MRSEALLELIRELDKDNDWKGAGELDIETECENRSIPDWEDILGKLSDRGLIIKTNKGLWKAI